MIPYFKCAKIREGDREFSNKRVLKARIYRVRHQQRRYYETEARWRVFTTVMPRRSNRDKRSAGTCLKRGWGVDGLRCIGASGREGQHRQPHRPCLWLPGWRREIHCKLDVPSFIINRPKGMHLRAYDRDRFEREPSGISLSPRATFSPLSRVRETSFWR